MSHVNHADFFNSQIKEIDFSGYAASGDIVTLNEHEISYVNGGIVPVIVGAAVRCAASTACRVAVLAAAGAVAAAVGYENNRV